MKSQSQTQAGMVSILTILFFMIFISIFVVSFIRIMYDEQRQTTDNDLSASAYAAALSGIEDGKRILLHCNDPDPAQNKAGCTQMLSSGAGAGDCSAFQAAGGLRNGFLGIKNSQMDGNQVIVGPPEYKQYYTCLTILADTDHIVLPLVEGSSVVKPLRPLASTPFDSIQLSWSPDTTSTLAPGLSGYTVRPNSGNFETYANWQTVVAGPPSTTKRYPPVIRIQAIPYVDVAINLDTVDRESRTIFIVPTSSATAAQDINAIDGGRGSATAPGNLRTGGAPIVYANCSVSSSYSCTKVLTGFTSGTRSYYLRATVMYANTTSLTVKLLLGGTAATFDGVQPQIDVTGRANDVYRRVRAYTSFAAPSSSLPEYALESAAPVCKDMVVADAANSSYCP